MGHYSKIYFICIQDYPPHTTTGFSPADLFYDRHIKGTLNLMLSYWIDGEVEELTLSEWLANFQSNLRSAIELATQRERLAKQAMKAQFDKSAKLDIFKAGDMVLVLRCMGF